MEINGTCIRDRRMQLGLAASALSKEIGKDRSTIYRYEKGAIREVSDEIAEKLASALQLTTEEFILMCKEENQRESMLKEVPGDLRAFSADPAGLQPTEENREDASLPDAEEAVVFLPRPKYSEEESGTVRLRKNPSVETSGCGAFCCSGVSTGASSCSSSSAQNVPVRSVQGEKKIPSVPDAPLSDEEAELLEVFRKMHSSTRKNALQMMKLLSATEVQKTAEQDGQGLSGTIRTDAEERRPDEISAGVPEEEWAGGPHREMRFSLNSLLESLTPAVSAANRVSDPLETEADFWATRRIPSQKAASSTRAPRERRRTAAPERRFASGVLISGHHEAPVKERKIRHLDISEVRR